MEGLKFLNEDEVTSLFSDNEEAETNQEPSEETLELSDEDASMMFDNNGSDFDEDDSNNNGSKRIENNSNQENMVSFSSIAKQFVDEGIFDSLSDDEISNIKDIDSLRDLISNAIKNGLDERTKRVNEALEVGLDSNEIAEYENTIKFLHEIRKEDILAETEEADNLRHRLILQNFINEGMDQKDAVEKVKQIFKEGNDINKAEEALANNKSFFQEAYQNAMEEKRKESENYKSDIEKQTANLKASIMDDEKFMGEIEINEAIKKQAFKNLSEPIYKDRETGEMLTAIQKYQRENKTEFLKNLGLLFTITNGFKDISKLVNNSVRKRVTKEIDNIEGILRNPSTANNNLKMVTSSSSSGNKFKFDV